MNSSKNISTLALCRQHGVEVQATNSFYSEALMLLILAFSAYYLYVKNHSLSREKCKTEHGARGVQQEPQTDLELDDAKFDNQNDGEKILRKKIFLSRPINNFFYGYRGSAKQEGFIDNWRRQEFPSLIPPVELNLDGTNKIGITRNTNASSSVVKEVYLDYAGAALPTKSQLHQAYTTAQQPGNQVFVNPHTSSESTAILERTKQRVLDFCQCGNDGKYDMIFTSGATDSLRIVAETFPWSKGSVFVYSHNSHTSVVGMRNLARSMGATFKCRSLTSICNATSETFLKWGNEADCEYESNQCSASERGGPSSRVRFPTNHLLVLPMECNFGGSRANRISSISAAAREVNRRGNGHSWFTMIDIAKAVATGPVNLAQMDVDFACLSFYKLFGSPTGLGALIIKRTVWNELLSRNENMYFGGGSVDAIVPSEDFLVPRNNLHRLVNGTVHYRGIAELKHGFDELEKVGGSDKILLHTRCLACEMVNRLRLLCHPGGKQAVIIYGAWTSWKSNEVQYDSLEQMRGQLDQMPGPTIAFNVLRSDGSFVGYSEVSNLAALSNPRIHLRTGCFCNTGACQESLKLSNKDIKQNFAAGHVCGDQNDLINGRPTGAVRISFGKDSIWEDLDAGIKFITKYFVREADLNDDVEKALAEYVEQNDALRHDKEASEAKLTDIFVFPIKSCAAMRVLRWKVYKQSGKLAFDREFALVDNTGRALRLSSYPKMALIKPALDLANMKMVVSAPARESLVLDLNNIHSPDETTGVSVCGKECNAKIYGDVKVSNWFSAVVGVRCWFAKYDDTKVHSQLANASRSSGIRQHTVHQCAFANDAPILLVSRNSVNLLNAILSCKGQRLVDARYFRPNLVVDVSLGRSSTAAMNNPEDLWSILSIGKVTFNVTGKCARCTMVDYDPTSGMKGKTLSALADYRRSKGSIYFGIFLEAAECSANMEEEFFYVNVDDIVQSINR